MKLQQKMNDIGKFIDDIKLHGYDIRVDDRHCIGSFDMPLINDTLFVTFLHSHIEIRSNEGFIKESIQYDDEWQDNLINLLRNL